MWRILILLLTAVYAQPAAAAVILNEVAWMGSLDSANDEWIELYNSGASADVTGWVLSDGGALSITLEGTIPSGAYAVLERTDDTTAPGTAFMIYTGALANDGRTLTLRRADNGIEDQVAGGTDWNEIGGDNTTKETAQLTSKGWVTGVATPGEANVSQGTPPVDDEEENEDDDTTPDNINEELSSRSSSDSKNVHISLMVPAHELTLAITAPKTTFINQRTPLSVTASGISEKLIPSLSYSWNFGNLVTASGTAVTVQYQKPGEYVVIVEARYARHVARARHQITVLPTPLALARDLDGTLLIHNNAQYEVDVSGFTLSAQAQRRIPKNTFIAPNATLPIIDPALSVAPQITLLDTEQRVVATFDVFAPKTTEAATEVRDEEKIPLVVIDQSPSPAPKISALATSVVPETIAAEPVVVPGTSTNVAAVSAAAFPFEKLPYLGLIGLIIIGTLAMYTQKREG